MGGGSSKGEAYAAKEEGDWTRKIAADGSTYFFNKNTNERRTLLIEEMPENIQNIATSWVELFDSSSQQPYYWNNETNETTWEIPAELDELFKQEEQYYLQQLLNNKVTLHLKTKNHINGWQEIYQSSESSNILEGESAICFYHNTETGTLTYGTPVEVVRNQQKLRSEELMSTWDGDQLMAKMKELNNEIKNEMETLHDRVHSERYRQRLKMQENLKSKRKRQGEDATAAKPPEPKHGGAEELILRDMKARRKKYKSGLKTHLEEQYNAEAEWQMWEEIIDPASKRPYYHNVQTGKTQWTMPPGLTVAYEAQEKEMLVEFLKNDNLKMEPLGSDKKYVQYFDPKSPNDFVVYKNLETGDLSAERPEQVVDSDLKNKTAKLEQAEKILNETWDGNKLKDELQKLRNQHEDELMEYASTVQDERKRQREKMREKLRERKRQQRKNGAAQNNSDMPDSPHTPSPPRTNDAYLDKSTVEELSEGNDSFAALMSM